MIIAVGKLSSEGKLKESFEDVDPTTPLQDKLVAIAKDMGKIGLITAIVSVAAMFISFFVTRGMNGGWTTSDVGLCFSYIVLGITVLVVSVPEGLPLAVTIALAYSVLKMYKEKNFVKTLIACETMGEANNICTDKTGTLTKNEMEIVEVWLSEHTVYQLYYLFIYI